jgi:hypothetical protein
MSTKADNPEGENRTNKEATDGQTSPIVGSTLPTTDSVGQTLHWTSGMSGGENA